MKKLSILLTITMAVVLSSCSSDDSSATSENFETLIIGKWKLVETGKIIDGEEVPNSSFFQYNGEDYSYCIESYWNFLPTNIVQVTYIICPDLPDDIFLNGSMNWEIEGNNLYLSLGSDLHTNKIQHLNANSLNLQRISGNSVSYRIFNKVD